MPESFDVVIVGAGAAGLAAAGELTDSGLRVVVLEARNRIGGRIFTHEDSGNYIEMGAEFIHGLAPGILEPLRANHIPIQELQGESWCYRDDRLSPCDFFDDVDKVLDRMDANEPDQSFQAFLDRAYPASQVNPRQREILDRARAFVSGFNAADPSRVGVHWLVKSAQAEEKIDGDREFRPVKGYQRLIDWLAGKIEHAGIEIRMEAIVSSIQWSRGRAKVSLGSSEEPELEAKAVLITIPVGVLKASPGERGTISFSPELPASKSEALSRLEMGKALRVTFRFRQRFWDQIVPEGTRRSLSGMRFLLSQDSWFPTWWTALPDRSPVLTGWAPFRSAERLSALPRSKVFQCGLQTLGSLMKFPLAELERLLEAAYFHNWQGDPFSRGAYSYGGVGADGAQEALAEPLENTLFFAGEATDTTGNNGTVHGAIASGNRAAREILKTLR